MRAVIFSIEEFSLFDGPGIRTTVFMKGCPMRCRWCHNPEGQLFEPQVVRSPNGCVGCGRCLDAGERACGKRVLTPESVVACERGLVRVCGSVYTVEGLLEVLVKNLVLLNEAGGGITFSGGEVLSSDEFVHECLLRLRGRTHRAIQTSGYGSVQCFRTLLSECDYVMYDLKIIDPALHKKYTDCDNSVILDNFRLLAGSGVDYAVRIPLIPSVTDTPESLTSIAVLMRENGADYAELLPYNKMAGAKYALTGQSYNPDFQTDKGAEAHTEIFRKHGIHCKIL